MSKNKKGKSFDAKPIGPASVNLNATYNADTILKILQDSEAQIPSYVSETETKLKRNASAGIFVANDIPALEFTDEPDIVVNSPYVSAKGGLFSLRHVNNDYLLYLGNVKTSIQPTKAASHYLLGSRSFEEPHYSIWYVRDESGIIERRESDVVSTKNLGVQAYLYVQRSAKNGKVGHVEKIDVVNLGNNPIEVIFEGKKYHSDSIKRPWYAVQ